MKYYKQEVLGLLEKSGVRYKLIEHKAMFCEADEDTTLFSENDIVIKNLFLRDSKGRHFYLIVLPLHKRADLKKIAEEIGSTRLGFASETRLMEYLAITPGSVSPFCLLNNEAGDIPVYFDKDLRGLQSVGAHPNDNTATVLMAFEDLLRLSTANGNPVNFIEI
ncbi:MAG: prolyl-tRNA synthetase associated domain-containing protein [Ruminococcus sp.]|nr:prolyl-tRNA synthetase associated domain-containing protein [Ruminococcus sp.]